MDLEGRIVELEARLAAVLAENVRLKAVLAENVRLEAVLADNVWLAARVAELEARLAKNSSNSSLPPSTDDPRERAARAKRTSQRTNGGRKPGGQRGRKGNTMVRVDDPDRIIEHFPTACGGCGSAVDPATAHGRRVRRQVFDLVDRPVEGGSNIKQCAVAAYAGTTPSRCSPQKLSAQQCGVQRPRRWRCCW